MIISSSKNSNRGKSKKILIFIAIPIFAIIFGFLAYRPILDKIDQDRFAKLDTQMRKVYKSIEEVSGKSDAWTYEKSCEPEYSGPWQTGRYYCTTKISMDKTIASAKEVADLQDKYYPIIDSSEVLKAESKLDSQPAGDFGISFVVSSAEKRYIEDSTKVSCNYLNKLDQTVDDKNFSTKKYGSVIEDGVGSVNMSLTCSGKSYKNWY